MHSGFEYDMVIEIGDWQIRRRCRQRTVRRRATRSLVTAAVEAAGLLAALVSFLLRPEVILFLTILVEQISK